MIGFWAQTRICAKEGPLKARRMIIRYVYTFLIICSHFHRVNLIFWPFWKKCPKLGWFCKAIPYCNWSVKITWPDFSFEESYLSEFLSYDIRRRCVWKLLIHTSQILTCHVPQNILRADTTGFVYKWHFLALFTLKLAWYSNSLL